MMDEKILELQQKLKDKESNLKEIKFVPVTNCVLILFGETTNIRTIDSEYGLFLIEVLSKYNETLTLKGYTIKQWITDLKLRLEYVTYITEIKKIEKLKSDLRTLMSDDFQKKEKLKLIEEDI